MKEIRIRDYSEVFGEKLEAFKSDANISANSKALEQIVLQFYALKERNKSLDAKLQRMRSENVRLMALLSELAEVEDRRKGLIQEIKAL